MAPGGVWRASRRKCAWSATTPGLGRFPDADRYSYAVQDLAGTIRACRPDVLLLWGQPSDAASWQRILNQHAELDLCRIPSAQLPPSCRGEEGLVIAVRRELAGREGIGDLGIGESPRTASGEAGRAEEAYGTSAAAGRPSPVQRRGRATSR